MKRRSCSRIATSASENSMLLTPLVALCLSRVLGPAFLGPGLDLYRRHLFGIGTRPRASPEGTSAVDAYGLSGDEVACRREQVGHGRRDLFGTAEPFERHLLLGGFGKAGRVV